MQIKRLVTYLIAAAMIFGLLPTAAVPASAEDVISGTTGNCTWTLEGTVLTISGYGRMNGSSMWLGAYVTEVIMEPGITSIGDRALCDMSFTSITIPDSVTYIGDEVFANCSSLTSITIPDGVTYIGYEAFLNCSSLTSVTIPDSVTYIGYEAFLNCGSLTSITIPDGVTDILAGTFQDCNSLTSITIPDSVTYIGNEVFANCSSLTSITIPDGVTYIGYGAFRGCSSLTSVTIPDSVTYIGYIGDEVFANCSSLTSITIPDGVTYIGYGAFRGCSSLTSVTIPDSVTYIGNEVFANCSSLTSITIPDSVTYIESYAFLNCGSLTSITIPDSVTEIYYDAFSSCESMTEVVFEGNAPNFFGDVFYNVMATAYYPAGNETWTENVMKDYGGIITWVPYEVKENAVEEWNVSLEDDLKVNFYLDGEIVETAQATVTVGDSVKTCNISELEKDENGRYIVSVNVAAAQMTDTITVQVDDMEPASYTVRQYCDTILGDESYSQYHQLVKEMLNYGAMAQIYFDYHTEALANDGITGVAAEEVPDTTADLSVDGEADGMEFYGASLVYRDKIAVRLYYNVTGNVSDCTFTANGNVYTPVLKDGRYYVEVADILPQDLEQQITLTATDSTGNTLTVSYGPMNYIVRMNQKGSESTKNLLKALYNYHLAAKALRTEAV